MDKPINEGGKIDAKNDSIDLYGMKRDTRYESTISDHESQISMQMAHIISLTSRLDASPY